MPNINTPTTVPALQLVNVNVKDPKVAISVLQNALNAVIGTMLVREGRSGSNLDKGVTWRDLYAQGVVSVTDEDGETHTNIPEDPEFLPMPTNDQALPPAISGLTVNGAIQSIIVEWDEPAYTSPVYAYAEIWASSTDDIGTAVKVGMSPGSAFADYVGATGEIRYYWVRAVTTADKTGPFNAVSGTVGSTGFVEDSDIGAGAIGDLNQFIAGVRPLQIVSSLPTLPDADYPQGAVVFNTGDNKLYRSTGSAWTNQVSASDLSGQLSGGQVAPGAIGSSHLTTELDARIGTSPTPDVTAPGAPTGLTATGGIRQIFLEWTSPGDGDIQAYEIWRSATNSRATSSKVGETPATVYSDPVASGSTYYYWVLAYDFSGNVGPYNAASGATGTVGTTGLITDSDIGNSTISGTKLVSINASIITAGTLDAARIAVGTLSGDKIIAGTLAAEKITSGTIATALINIGNNRLELDGTNNRIRIRDQQGSPVVRVVIGKLGAAATDYGIEIYNSTGALIASSINGLGSNTVGASQVVAGAIIAGKLAVGAIVAGDGVIGNLAVSNAQIANLAVDAAKIADATIVAAKIVDATITGAKIANATITGAKIVDATITTAKIADAQITTAKIGDAQITSAKIVDATITGAKIANATIENVNILNGTIQGSKISSSTTITAGNSTDVAVLDGAHADYRIYAGHNVPGSAPFRVSKTGQLYATSGEISGDMEIGGKIENKSLFNVGYIQDRGTVFGTGGFSFSDFQTSLPNFFLANSKYVIVRAQCQLWLSAIGTTTLSVNPVPTSWLTLNGVIIASHSVNGVAINTASAWVDVVPVGNGSGNQNLGGLDVTSTTGLVQHLTCGGSGNATTNTAGFYVGSRWRLIVMRLSDNLFQAGGWGTNIWSA